MRVSGELRLRQGDNRQRGRVVFIWFRLSTPVEGMPPHLVRVVFGLLLKPFPYPRLFPAFSPPLGPLRGLIAPSPTISASGAPPL